MFCSSTFLSYAATFSTISASLTTIIIASEPPPVFLHQQEQRNFDKMNRLMLHDTATRPQALVATLLAHEPTYEQAMATGSTACFICARTLLPDTPLGVCITWIAHCDCPHIFCYPCLMQYFEGHLDTFACPTCSAHGAPIMDTNQLGFPDMTDEQIVSAIDYFNVTPGSVRFGWESFNLALIPVSIPFIMCNSCSNKLTSKGSGNGCRCYGNGDIYQLERGLPLKSRPAEGDVDNDREGSHGDDQWSARQCRPLTRLHVHAPVPVCVQRF